MPRCSVCSHPQRREIDIGLLRGLSIRDAANRFNLSRAAVGRHKQNHIPVRIARIESSQNARDEERAARDVGEELAHLWDEAAAVLEEARASGAPKTALAAIKELRHLLDLRLRASELEVLERRLAELEARVS